MKTTTGILFMIFYITVFGQQVPNGNFESWYNESNYENPTYWDTPNSTTGSLNIFTVVKESQYVQNGNYAVKIQSKSILGTPVPGLITLGDFNVNIINFVSTIEGGYPFTYKPKALHGYFQYEPLYGDQAFIGVLLLRQNGNSWDTIADGSFTTTQTALNWTPFTVNINYKNELDPTHLNIIILSSDKDAPQPNSTLYIDNLYFEYPTISESIDHNIQPTIYMYNENIIVEYPEEVFHVNVYDILQKLLISKECYNGQNVIPVYTKGLFFVEIISKKQHLTYKIVIP